SLLHFLSRARATAAYSFLAESPHPAASSRTASARTGRVFIGICMWPPAWGKRDTDTERKFPLLLLTLCGSRRLGFARGLVFAEYMPPWPGDEPFSCRALGSPRALQLWIVRGERSLLRTRIATTESVSLCVRM